MSPEFHWQTGGRDADWEYEAATSAERLAHRGGRRHIWLLWGAISLIMVGVIVGLARQRVQRAETLILDQVLNSHRLIQLANTQRDIELFRVVLSGRDRVWGDQMTRLIATGAFFDRPAFGLKASSEETEEVALFPDRTFGAENVEVRLSPELTSAEVSWLLPYQAGDQTLTLRQTAVYRRGRQSWLLSPPETDFWGGWDVIPGQRLTVVFPLRDQEIARRLAGDLERLLVEVCRTLAVLNCPEDLHLRLRMETEPNGLLAAGTTSLSIHPGLQLQLPAPTLIGLPLDEAGYQALFKGYGAHVVAAVITERLSYNCCQQGLFYQALLEAQLVQLGLRSRPLTQLQYERLAQNQVSLHDVGRYWNREHLAVQAGDVAPVYALVDFLADENREPVLFMPHVLSPSATLGFWDWLHLVTKGEYATNQALERAWLQFLGQKTAVRRAPPFPDQELLLACQPDPTANAALYRYRLETGLIEKEFELAQKSVSIVGLPGDEGVVVGEQRSLGGATVTRLLLWQGETHTVLSRSMDDILPVSFTTSPAGDQLLVLNRRLRQYGLLSPGRCQSGGNCAIDAFHGLLLWSPDGRQTVSLIVTGNYGYEDRFARPFVLGSITGDILGTGKAPFWFDDETIAFIDPLDRAIMTVSIYDSSIQQELLSVVNLVSSIPDREQVAQMRLEHIAFDPIRADSFLIVAADADNTYFFRYHLPTDHLVFETMTNIRLEAPVLYNYDFSPDGRWLVISGSNLIEGTSTIHLYDIGQKETQSYQFAAVYDLPLHWLLDWSADGQWLSVPDNGHLRLIAPADEYQTLIVPGDMLCSGIAWVNKNDEE